MLAVAGNNASSHHFFLGLRFLAVFSESLKSLAVVAPLEPGFRIFSPDPAAMRFRFALILAYKPRFLRMGAVAYSQILLLFRALTLWLFLLGAVTVVPRHKKP